MFHKEDKQCFAGALYQTLFLLVPVLSSTFASLGTFLCDAKQAGVIGTLIIDEAGQAQPQMAVGALYRSRKAMIVEDPKQIEPVVTDDLDMLKSTFDDEELKPYKSKTISVQSLADKLNHFGTYLDNGTDYPEWVGCSLLVHRRCISPMYDISNEISYNGIMKQQTREPDVKRVTSFVYEKSQWIHVIGKEKGNKNHFVEEQARKGGEILEVAFSQSDHPNMYIISPFTSVVNGMKTYIKEYQRKAVGINLSRCEFEWISKKIGTVHTFQGKEANEVIVPSQTSIDLFQGVYIPSEWDNSYANCKFDIDVQADAVQSKNFTPDFEQEDPWGNVTIETAIQTDSNLKETSENTTVGTEEQPTEERSTQEQETAAENSSQETESTVAEKTETSHWEFEK